MFWFMYDLVFEILVCVQFLLLEVVMVICVVLLELFMVMRVLVLIVLACWVLIVGNFSGKFDVNLGFNF